MISKRKTFTKALVSLNIGNLTLGANGFQKNRGYRLQGDLEPVYVPITNNQSEPLQLQLMVEDKIIAFYRLDNGVRLLPLEELNIAIEQETQRAEAEFRRAEMETQRTDREAQRAQELEAQIAIYQQKLGEPPLS
jgi:hypothetical protein